MTPDDVTARRLYQIRENLAGRDDTSDDDVLALCDALEAAWAERDASNDSNLGHCDLIEKLQVDAGLCDCENLRERAERAEAEASVTTEALRHLGARADVMAAALARVRSLCDAEPTCWDDVQWQAAIRAAIEGDNQ